MDPDKNGKGRLIGVVLIVVVIVFFTLLIGTGKINFRPEKKEIKPDNVTPKKDNVTPQKETRTQVKLSKRKIAIKNGSFVPKDIQISLEEGRKGQVAKGEVVWMNNDSRSYTIYLQKGDFQVLSLTVPPGESVRRPFYKEDKGNYLFKASGVDASGTIRVN